MPQKTLPIIRRSVANSIKQLQSTFQTDSKTQGCRPLRYESLEDRRVLSATGLSPEIDPGTVDSGFVSGGYDSTDQIQADEISRIVVEVNGIQQELTATNNLLLVVEGDTIEVVEIDFQSDSTTGVFASEGYVNKISDLTSASLIDYNDGRFSQREANQEATGGKGTITGLSGEWSVETGWDRLTVNLMHYTDDSSEVAGRFFVNLSVGQPDFEFDLETLDQIKTQEIYAGDEVSIPAAWMNTLGGRFHNYAEVDIYLASNMDEIVWAGAAVGNVDADNEVRGEFLNNRSDDPFSERWTPEVEGKYVLKYYLDPEGATAETNEDNNEYEIRLAIKSKALPVANDDRFDGDTASMDVLENDTTGSEVSDLQVSEFTQPDHGEVSLNDDGTMQYTPDEGFSGVDKFEYSVTDGSLVSDSATVTVMVEKSLEVEANIIGAEDSNIALNIETNYDSVLISGVPKNAELSQGKVDKHGVAHIESDNLDGLTITPPPHSDADFQLTVTPVDDGVELVESNQVINVVVAPEVDSGRVVFSDFGIVAGKKGAVPVLSYFADRDGSEEHQLTLVGIPDFMELSNGQKTGSNWQLSAEDLDGLKIESSKTDISEWTEYRGRYAYQPFNISFELTSMESAGSEAVTRNGEFTIYAWQKKNSK